MRCQLKLPNGVTGAYENRTTAALNENPLRLTPYDLVERIAR